MTQIDFLSGGAAHGLVRALAADAGVQIAGHFGAVGAMRERFLAGEPCDIVILTHAQVMALCAQERAEMRLCADLGSVATSIAVRASDPAPDVDDASAVRKVLLASDAIYFPDPAHATAGIHFAKVLERLGIADAVKPRLRVFPNGSTAMAAMAKAAGNPVGCTQATEILATEGVKLVAPLPQGLDLSTVYTAAVSRAARHSVAAQRFFGRLADDAQAPARARAGFEGVRIRPATNRDADAAIRMMRAGHFALGLPWPHADVHRDYDDLETTFIAGVGAFDVGVSPDGEVAGCAGLQVIEGNAGRLRGMHVAPDWRRRGLARRLLERAIAFARSRRLDRIVLDTALAMREAIALYESAGFRRASQAPAAAGCDLVLELEL